LVWFGLVVFFFSIWLKLPEITQYCSAGFVLGPFFEAKALRTLRVDRVKDKDLSVELNLGKARPGEGRA